MMIRSVVIVTLAALLCGIIEVVLGQECAAGSAQFIAGNWYCQPITAITYRNFPGTGAYNRVVDMDINSGTCKSERHEYSGSLAPLNEEVGSSFSFLSFLFSCFLEIHPVPAAMRRWQNRG